MAGPTEKRDYRCWQDRNTTTSGTEVTTRNDQRKERERERARPWHVGTIYPVITDDRIVLFQKVFAFGLCVV